MGIVNLSQNSFYSSSIIQSNENLRLRIKQFIDEGVDIIDLGANSSRPGSKIVDPIHEVKILEPAFKEIRAISSDTLISIDTLHASTARRMLELGADFINDISASEYDPLMSDVISEFNVPYIIMHMRGIPETMQSKENQEYEDVVAEVIKYFSRKKFEFLKKDIHQLIIDPGFGFSKNLIQNYELLNKLDLFQFLECPILVGISRKSMISKVLQSNAENALEGSLAAETIALIKGANILRVHDIKQTKDIIRIVQAFKGLHAKI